MMGGLGGLDFAALAGLLGGDGGSEPPPPAAATTAAAAAAAPLAPVTDANATASAAAPPVDARRREEAVQLVGAVLAEHAGLMSAEDRSMLAAFTEGAPAAAPWGRHL